MTPSRRRVLFLGMTSVVSAAVSIPARSAENYPNKPITWVVPFAAGTGVDTVARLVTLRAAQILGQPIVIDNRVGAGGTLGSALVAKSRHDGYMVLQGTNGTHGVASALYSSLPYDPLADFVPISRVTSVGMTILVSTASPINSLQALITDLKAHPGQRTFGTGGNGSIPHIAGQLFQAATGTKMTHVPYKGTAAALPDVLAGRLDMMIDTTTNSFPQVKAGKLRSLVVLSQSAHKFAPEVPTLESIGVANIDVNGWDAAFVPAGTPLEIQERLNEALTKALSDPDISGQLASRGVETTPTSLAQSRAFMSVEIPKWRDAARASGAKVE